MTLISMKTAVSYVHLLSGGITSNLGILPLILFIPKIVKKLIERGQNISEDIFMSTEKYRIKIRLW